MKNMINFFVRYPSMVNLGLLLTVILGLLSFSQVRYTLDPSEKPKQIYIDLRYRGASPLEIEERVVTRIEENLQGVRGIDRYTSVSRENSGRITVEIEESANINEVLVEVENAVNRISGMPSDMEPPIVFKQEMLIPTINLAVTGDIPLQVKKDFARKIRDDFMFKGGASHVTLFGFGDEEIVIEIDDEEMNRYGITFAEIANSVRSSNIERTGGELKLDHANWQIRAQNKSVTALEIGQIPIRTNPSGQRLLLADVANVLEQFDDRPTQRYLNGEESVVIFVQTTNDKDLLKVAKYARDYVTEFNESSKRVKLTIVDDVSSFVNERVDSLWSNGLAGLVLVLLILTLFLDKRIAFWVALTIPLSLLGTFVFALFGYDLTINVVSIFGFILVLGMLVDTGVVVAENIYRQYVDFGKNPIQSVRDGAAEVASPMIISLLTTAVAFSLFFYLPGKPGAFFSEVSFVVITALLSALIVTFFFLPAKMYGSKVLTAFNSQTRFEKFFAGILTRFRDNYFMPFTDIVSHKWKWVNFAAFMIALLGSVLIVRTGILPVTFFPNLDDDIQLIRIELQPGTPADTTYSHLIKLQEVVKKVGTQLSEKRSDNEAIIKNIELMMGPNSHQGQLRIVMMGGEERKIPAFEINNMFREAAEPIRGARYIRFMGATAEMRFGGLPVDISVTGVELPQIQHAASLLKQKMEVRDDLIDVADNNQQGNPELNIELNTVGEQLGISLQEVISQIRAAFFGMEVQNLQRNKEDIRIWIRFPKELLTDFKDLANLKIRTPRGIYPLSEIATIIPTNAQLQINRTNGQRTIRVDADLAHPSLSAPAILTDIEQNIIPQIKNKYPNVNFVIEGQNRESGNVVGAMQRVAPMILVVILALISINFQSYSQTFMVLLSLPFAFIGVVIGHIIHGATMNIFSLIGMIALVGILINNLLVLISAFNDNLRAGYTFDEALKDAVQSRFRPILLTTLSTIAGLVPMIFIGGLASAFLKPPAISIAYGLIFGLPLTLTLTPAFMVINNQIRQRLAIYRGISTVSPESVEPAVKLNEHHRQSEL